MCNFQGLVPSYVEAVPKILLHFALVIFRLNVRQEEEMDHADGSCHVLPNFGVTSTYHVVKPRNHKLYNTAVMQLLPLLSMNMLSKEDWLEVYSPQH